MKILTDTDYKRIAQTLDGPCLKGFEMEHTRRGGDIPLGAKESVPTRTQTAESIFTRFNDIFGKGAAS